MAKYSRYDPRNKNKGKQKDRTLEKDLRIKDSTLKSVKFKLKSTQAEKIAELIQKEDI
jgi:hypothetical protein|tara:strand:- start:1723 stop:1896 length:174 start_codon:yes stop_codon:yes gene_type:complete